MSYGIVLLFSLLGIGECLYSVHPVVPRHTLNFSQSYNYSLNKDIEYILEFQSETDVPYPPRVSVWSDNADDESPLMVVARQRRELLSWQLPLTVESQSGNKRFYNMSRTICRHMDSANNSTGSLNKQGNPIVTVSTASETNVSFTIQVDYQEDFYIDSSKVYNITISPSQPKYYLYRFPQNMTNVQKNMNYDTVLLEVSSDDSVCMTVSIQNIGCPVFDSNEDITFRGFYETVSKKGGITIPRSRFPGGFYVVLVAKGDDADCSGRAGLSSRDRTKRLSLVVKPSITYDDYVLAAAATLLCIAAFYLVFGVAFFMCSRRCYRPRRMDCVLGGGPSAGTSPDVPTVASVPLFSASLSVEALVRRHGSRVGAGDEDGVSLGDAEVEAEYDLLEEADVEREVRLCRSRLYLCDLARKDPRIIRRRSYLYLYNVLTVAVFYGLPVVQLVLTYQNVLNETGQQDLCYYNFLCAHPLGFLSDFNHVFSNIGYILFGILFLFIVYRREITHNDLNFERYYGIPQHYGLFYAMGVSLIMEGVLSGSYHICPNTSNFQFDSSFMYVMAVLCVVKLYQNRHPDINATAYTTFGILAIAIFLGLIGILEGNIYFWSAFTVVHVITCLYLSAQIYFMGCWKLDRGLVMRTYRMVVNDFRSGPINVIRPTHKARMWLIIIGNVCNWGIASLALTYHQKDFALYLLAIFMMNTVLYFCFYIIMKKIHKENINCLPLGFLVISICCAVSAMYFFLHKSISWQTTPAESRFYNQECKLLRFYDYHDIWHFLSAVGMFFTFMVLLTLDDDLSHTARSEIRVF